MTQPFQTNITVTRDADGAMGIFTVPTEKGKKVLTMAEYFAGGHLRFVNGEWRDDNGDAIEISRVRHGKWIHETIEDDDWGGTYHSWSCSECKFSVGRNPTDENFCSKCGAKMDLEERQ